MRLTTSTCTHVKAMHDLGLMGPDTTLHPLHGLDRRGARPDRRDRRHGLDRAVRRDADGPRAAADREAARLAASGPSLSVDVVSSVPGEMFTQMRTALVYDRILAFTDTPDEAFAPKLTHRDVLEFATIDGARACGLEDRVGLAHTRQAGRHRPAQRNAINTAPMVDPVATIVVFADTSNVDSVFVAGRAVKRHGELVDADLGRTFRRLEESRNHILGEGGLLPDWAAAPTAAA